MILHVKLFYKCIITGIWILMPFHEWVARVVRVRYIFFNWIHCPSMFHIFYMESAPQMARPILECGVFQTMCLPTGLANYWWQQITDCKLLISILWPLLAAADICCSELCVDRLRSLLLPCMWASEKFCQYSLHIYPYKNKIVEKFSEYSLCILQTKIGLWRKHCIA